MKITWEVKNFNNRVTVCKFNNGYSHISVDGSCWVILNGGNPSPYIFEEAAKILKQLPSKPTDYLPYTNFIGML